MTFGEKILDIAQCGYALCELLCVGFSVRFWWPFNDISLVIREDCFHVYGVISQIKIKWCHVTWSFYSSNFKTKKFSMYISVYTCMHVVWCVWACAHMCMQIHVHTEPEAYIRSLFYTALHLTAWDKGSLRRSARLPGQGALEGLPVPAPPTLRARSSVSRP